MYVGIGLHVLPYVEVTWRITVRSEGQRWVGFWLGSLGSV